MTERDPSAGVPPLVTPFLRELLDETGLYALLVAVALLEVFGWLRIGSFATGWSHSTLAGMGFFVGGAVFEGVRRHARGGPRPWILTELPNLPPEGSIERPGRTVLRVCISAWSPVLAVVAGLMLPLVGGFGGGAALAAAFTCVWRVGQEKGAERRRGWRTLWSAPRRIDFPWAIQPEVTYYRGSRSTT